MFPKEVTVTYYGKPLIEGNMIKDFRGDEWVFHAILYGKVYDKSRTDSEKILFREFYVTVFPGLVVEDVEDDDG